jgi:hypothetical protein
VSRADLLQRGVTFSAEELQAQRTAKLLECLEVLESDFIDGEIRPLTARRTIEALQAFLPPSR